MEATLERPRRYGLILRRHAGQALVVHGPARVHFLAGNCQAIIVHQDLDQPCHLVDRCVHLTGPALIYWIHGSGRIGTEAPKAIRVLRAELLGGLFASDPLLAAIACRTPLSGDGPVQIQSARLAVTHVQRTDEGIRLCPDR